MKTFGASWDTIARDWSSAACSVEQAVTERRRFTLISFDANDQLLNRGEVLYGLEHLLSLVGQ